MKRASGRSVAFPALLLGLAACGDSTTEPPPPPATELPVETPASLQACVTGTSGAGALMELCLPAVWNGEVIAWAHGYVNPGPDRPPHTPLALPGDAVEGTEFKDIARGIGTTATGFYGYASTSYRRNGLVAADAAADLEDLAAFLRQSLDGVFGTLDLPTVEYLVGASEGALSTVLVLEDGRTTPAFDGGLALCGPVGDFRRQLDHLGDFRAVFDVYFPALLPGDATGVPDPEGTITEANWQGIRNEIRTALAADPEGAEDLFRITGVPVDETDPGSGVAAAVDVLRYSFFGTNDARAVLGGNPFGNADRVYVGSTDDAGLNAAVDRFMADEAARDAVDARYQTTGRLRVPLVALHTTRDPIVPFRHLELYEEKVALAGAGARFSTIPSQQYGHCRFTLPELFAAFSRLVLTVSGQNLTTSAALLAGPADQRDFLDLARAAGARPTIAGGGPSGGPP